jgi:hypothetical protein
LERNELRNLVEEHQTKYPTSALEWVILRDEIVSDGDHGRTLIEFIAQLQWKQDVSNHEDMESHHHGHSS